MGGGPSFRNQRKLGNSWPSVSIFARLWNAILETCLGLYGILPKIRSAHTNRAFQNPTHLLLRRSEMRERHIKNKFIETKIEKMLVLHGLSTFRGGSCGQRRCSVRLGSRPCWTRPANQWRSVRPSAVLRWNRACSRQTVWVPAMVQSIRGACRSEKEEIVRIRLRYELIGANTCLPRAKRVVVTWAMSFFSHRSTVWKTSMSGTP